MSDNTDMPMEPRNQLAVVQQSGGLSVGQVIERLTAIQDLMKNAMIPDVDYGKIPGTGSKPTLLKSGAEKLGLMFRLDPQFETKNEYSDDGHLTSHSTCTIFHAPTGDRLGSASAVCTTRESKYAVRKGQMVCPACGKPAIIKSKAEWGGGWLCFAKKGGCGSKFEDQAPTIISQSKEDVPNDKLADSYNTVIRMAEKRAYLAATRLVTGCSAIFDEEYGEHERGMGDHPPDPPQQPKTDPPKKKVPEPNKEPEALNQAKLEALRKALAACERVVDLKTVWGTVPKAYQPSLMADKDQFKKDLEEHEKMLAQLPKAEDGKLPWD